MRAVAAIGRSKARRASQVKRLLATVWLGTCIISAAAAQTVPPYPPVTLPLQLDRLPGRPIWISTGSPGVPGKDNEGNTSNAGFVVTPEGVVVSTPRSRITSAHPSRRASSMSEAKSRRDRERRSSLATTSARQNYPARRSETGDPATTTADV